MRRWPVAHRCTSAFVMARSVQIAGNLALMVACVFIAGQSFWRGAEKDGFTFTALATVMATIVAAKIAIWNRE